MQVGLEPQVRGVRVSVFTALSGNLDGSRDLFLLGILSRTQEDFGAQKGDLGTTLIVESGSMLDGLRIL